MAIHTTPDGTRIATCKARPTKQCEINAEWANHIRLRITRDQAAILREALLGLLFQKQEAGKLPQSEVNEIKQLMDLIS
jgi:hypothetical protein